MKKIIFITLFALLLVGCTQVNDTPSAESKSTPRASKVDVFNDPTVPDATADTKIYNNEEYNISFQYPSNWEVIDKQKVKKMIKGKLISEEEKFEHSVVLKTRRGTSFYLDYQSDSFNEYEKRFESFEQFEINGQKIGGYSIEKVLIANYPAKIYKEWGLELPGVTYIVEKNGKFIQYNLDFELNEEEQIELEKILKSFMFK